MTAWLVSARRGVVAAICVAAFVAFGITQAPALGSTAIESGTLLPAHDESSLSSVGYMTGSPDYVLHSHTPYQQGVPTTHSIVRVSDGATVQNLPTGDVEPTLVNHSYVEMFRSSTGSPDRVEVHDDETGQLQRTLDLAGGSHRSYLHGDEQWAAVSDVGVDTGHNSLSFIRSDQAMVTADVNFFSVPRWIGGDSATAYVTADNDDYAVDTETGHATPVDFPDRGANLFAVTPSTLIGSEEVYPSTGVAERFYFLDRSTGALTRTVDVPFDYHQRGFVPYGSGVAELYLPDNVTSDHHDLRPVDLATGDLLPPIATDVLDARPLGNGQVVVAIAGTPTGRLAVAPDASGSVSTVLDLPALPRLADRIALSGSTVAASWKGLDHSIWTMPAAGGDTWSQAAGSDGSADRQSWELAGDTLLTGPPASATGVQTYHLQWPVGGRDFQATSAELGHGGSFMTIGDPDQSGTTQVVDVRTGAVAASWTQGAGPATVVDADTLWKGPNAHGVLTGVDLTGSGQDQSVDLGPACADGGLYDVRGRWAMLDCKGMAVFDLKHVMDPYPVPYRNGAEVLGDGFVAETSVVTDGAGASSIELTVTDLSAGHETRSYGPLAGALAGDAAFAVNDVGSKDLVYVDTSDQIRRVDLAWLGTSPEVRPDGTAPTLIANPNLPAAVASTTPVTLTPSWGYQDVAPSWEPQSGIASYDVRERAPDSHDWVLPNAWSDLPTASVSVMIDPDSGRCFSARARDKAGNVSDWSPAACEYVDSQPPVLAHPDGFTRYPAAIIGQWNYTWGATDPGGVASYDLATRTAAPGKPLSAWTISKRSTTATHLTRNYAQQGTEVCYRFRARDLVGHVSAWSGPGCWIMPVDDTYFAVAGQRRFGSSDRDINATDTQLLSRGSSASLRGQTGRRIGLWIIRGPREGRAALYAGAKHLATINFYAAKTARTLVQVPVAGGFSGTIRVTDTTDKPVILDAIAVSR